MNIKTTTCHMRVNDAEEALRSYIQRYGPCATKTRESVLYAILAFLESLQRDNSNPPGMLIVSESRLMDWIESVSSTGGVNNASQKVQYIARFMRYLHETGVIAFDPMALIRSRVGSRGWTSIVRALRSGDSLEALKELRVEPAHSGSFGRHAQEYIELHRATGKQYRINEAVLVDFNRFLRRHADDSITSSTPAVVREWGNQTGSTQGSRYRRVQILQQFFRHAVCLKLISANPVTQAMLDEIGKPKTVFRPYIFSLDQIRSLLNAALKLTPTPTFPMRPQVMHTVTSILYTLGLRISEVVHLHVGDIDMDRDTIFIRQSKFYKERLAPYGPRLRKCLMRYLDARRHFDSSMSGQDPLFLGCAGRPATVHLIRNHFKRMMIGVGIPPSYGARLPRVHDLRHTFAVHRLLRWYREGVDVQERLVLLSTFMGHGNIYATQPYLTITGALLNEASGRFHAAFGSIAEEEASP